MKNGSPMEMAFLADEMLGRLATWLRILGYDTHYQSFYRQELFEELIRDGRRLITRRAQAARHYPDSLFIRSDHIREQISEMRHAGVLTHDRSRWFSRCLICNVPLKAAKARGAMENVPEYISYENMNEIRHCPRCGRHFWPGSHKTRMLRQLEEWGF
jgi:uncharacterized protein with PIN domain